MPGIKGMKRASAANVIRRKIWRSIRILRRFTLSEVMITVPGATMDNVKKYVHQLSKHGYVTKNGALSTGRRGEYQTFQLVRNSGPTHPTRCDVCGKSISEKFCFDPKKEKEKETEKETETEIETAADPLGPKEAGHDQT